MIARFSSSAQQKPGMHNQVQFHQPTIGNDIANIPADLIAIAGSDDWTEAQHLVPVRQMQPDSEDPGWG
jgi:hypothetical protein